MKRTRSLEKFSAETESDQLNDVCSTNPAQKKPRKPSRGRKLTAELNSQTPDQGNTTDSIESTIDQVINQCRLQATPSASNAGGRELRSEAPRPGEAVNNVALIQELLLQSNQQQQTILSLKEEIKYLREQIHSMQIFLGLNTSSTKPPAQSLVMSSPSNTIEDQSACESGLCGGVSEATIVGGSVSVQSDQFKTSSVSNHRATNLKGVNQAPTPKQSLTEVVLDTIYRDAKERERRRKNVVVSGLETISGVSDLERVQQLFHAEFNFVPDIAFCKRLGAPTDGRIQPLLVALTFSEDSAWLVANATILRRSANQNVRKQVFINAFLSRAETRAAYEARCKRRTERQTKTDNQKHHTRLVVSSEHFPRLQSCNRPTELANTTVDTVETLPVTQTSTIHVADRPAWSLISAAVAESAAASPSLITQDIFPEGRPNSASDA